MTPEQIEQEYLAARDAQRKRPIPYPMTEAEKREYDYENYQDMVRQERYEKNQDT